MNDYIMNVYAVYYMLYKNMIILYFLIIMYI